MAILFSAFAPIDIFFVKLKPVAIQHNITIFFFLPLVMYHTKAPICGSLNKIIAAEHLSLESWLKLSKFTIDFTCKTKNS